MMIPAINKIHNIVGIACRVWEKDAARHGTGVTDHTVAFTKRTHKRCGVLLIIGSDESTATVYIDLLSDNLTAKIKNRNKG